MSQSEKQRLKCVAAGNKAARSCDSCQRTARWYCAADDAFLCQCCDASVHSANSVSHRHHRLQLRTPSPEAPLPAWLSGFTRKARTPRLHNKAVSPVVPELETSEENTEEKDEKQYLVPIGDYCSSASSPDDNYNTDVKPLLTTVQFPHDVSSNSNSNNSSDCLVGLLPSEMDLAEFAADMESLLGGGIDNGSFSMAELGLGDTNCGRQLIKEELDSQNTDGDIELYEEMDLSRETTLDINFDDRGSQTSEDDQEETKAAMTGLRPATQCQSRKKVGLRLDYEALITEWSVQGSCSPWMNGKRPQFGPDDCWLDCMGMWGGDQAQGLIDEGREARVSRYREKRRTRLFSKKIRYEVRKLNAEKRPRMKGRFVKRASFAGATTTATAGTAFPY